jgi:hypothetical protein
VHKRYVRRVSVGHTETIALSIPFRYHSPHALFNCVNHGIRKLSKYLVSLLHATQLWFCAKRWSEAPHDILGAFGGDGLYVADLVANPTAKQCTPKASKVVDRDDTSPKSRVRDDRNVSVGGSVLDVAEAHDIDATH